MSVSSSGAQGDGPSQGGSLSADGTLVVFHSEATNLVAGDTNGKKDVFLRDLTAGTTQRISISAAGDQPTGHCQDAVVSADGGLVAFQCQGTGITPDDLDEGPEVFVRNVQLGTVERASLGNGPTQSSHAGCSGFTLSGNGRYVAFNSDAPDLVEGDTNGTCDAFLRDLEEDVTILLSVSSNGIQSEAKAGATAISYDGRYVLFGSAASNLVDDDTNGFGDCFVRDVVAGTTTRVSVGPDGQEANKSSECGSLSADGRFVAFHSYATNFGADTQDQYQIWYKRVLP